MTPPTPPARHALTFSLLLIALTFLAYLPALRGDFIWDDDDYVTENMNLRSASGLADTWLTPRSSPQYYPMVFTTFWVEHQLWGMNATGYHLVNVLLHATAAVLLWRLLVMLGVPAAYLSAGLFALHPVQVESVAWITERKNVLSAVFYFGAALAYVAWSAHPSDPVERPKRDRSDAAPKSRSNLYLLSLFLFIAALLCKTVTCSLPAALLVVMWWKHGRITARDIKSLAPFFIVGLAFALTTVWLERSHVLAVGAEWDLSPIDRVLIAGRAVWFYATKLILPFNLSFIYPKWAIDPSSAIQWAFPVGVVVALFVLWRMRERWGREPLAGVLLFIGTLVPALGFFNIYPMRYAYVADHFQYHASVALIVLIAAGAMRVVGERTALILLLAPLLIMTMARSSVYRDVEALWRDTLTKNPDSWMVNLNLAKALVARDRHNEAWPLFERQMLLAPHLPETHWNYGSSLLQQRHYDQALAAYDEAIRLGGKSPLPQAYFGRGMVFMDQGKFAEAAAEFQLALELKPDYPAARRWFDEAMARLAQSPPPALPSSQP